MDAEVAALGPSRAPASRPGERIETLVRRFGVVAVAARAHAVLARHCTNGGESESAISRRRTAADRAAVSPDQARAIAKEAYVYGFPMVDNYRVMYSYFVDKDDPEYKGGWNEIHNTARVYTPADTAIQTPNSDTPVLRGRRRPAHRAAGAHRAADRAGPLLLAAVRRPYTSNFAYVGSRTTGNSGGKYLLAGPNWKGAEARGRQRGHPVRHRPGAGALPHPAVRPARPGQRQEDSGRLSGGSRCRCSSTSRRHRRPPRSTSSRR